MSLFDDASIIITPNGVKAGKLYALKGDDLNVVRATSATRVNASGLIETVSANVPRLDYSNGSCPSILVEPQRTNILLNSETLATQSVTVTAQPYTLSFYGSGTVTLSGTHTASVVGLGTARKTYTFTPTAGTLTLTITGTCTKGQLEVGSYATSHIPTTSSIVTRNADVISKTGISSLIGQTEGSIFCDVNLNLLNNSGTLLSLSNGSYNSFIILVINNSNRIQLFWRTNGGTINSFETPNAVSNAKIAVAYQSGNIVFYVNGILINTGVVDVNWSFPLSQLDLGNELGSVVRLQRNNISALWKTRLSNTQLAELTTI